MPTIPELVAYTGKLMFERRLTDISGGNVSALDGDSIVISPRFAGSKQHWHLMPEELLCDLKAVKSSRFLSCHDSILILENSA